MALWIPIILGLLSFFASKKSGAKSTTAALTGAAVGLGSYYVANETKWGQGVISDLDKQWTSLTGSDGAVITNKDGSPAKAPAGATVVTDASGNPTYDASGNVVWKAIDSAGKVLTSWGAGGTAAVIGTTAAATGSGIFSQPWVKYAVIGVGAILLLK